MKKFETLKMDQKLSLYGLDLDVQSENTAVSSIGSDRKMTFFIYMSSSVSAHYYSCLYPAYFIIQSK